ncbi:hypothetical protein GBA52_004892 [Prunus armeniaca]|nr:hypothetical protein GBA52_004892 [Prunus armeniaca]
MADDNGQYKVYGSVLCFGNTSVGDCGGCVRKAIAQIRGLCPYNKALEHATSNTRTMISQAKLTTKFDVMWLRKM